MKQYINEVSKIYTDETSMTMRDFHKRECINDKGRSAQAEGRRSD